MNTTMTPPQTDMPQYEITDKDKKRQQAIEDAWNAYNGLLPPPLNKMPDGTDPNVMSNRCMAVVDRGVDFLFGKEIEITCEEGSPQEAQDFLNEVWGRKETRIPLLQKLAMNGAIAGRAFLRIVPEPDKNFRLIEVDPAIVSVETAPQDCETVLLFCIQYCCDEKNELGKPIKRYYREEITRIDPDQDGDSGNPFADKDATWQIQHWTQVSSSGLIPKNNSWIPAGEPIIWPYPFPPISSCQNLPRPNDFWGMPDITPSIIGINKGINLVQSCVSLVEILYGKPILYVTGAGEGSIDFDPGKIIGLPLDTSKIVAVTLTSDVPNALAFLNNLRSDIDEESGVPGVATGRIADLPHGAMPGITIELMHSPLLMKTDKKRCTYGELIIDVSKALLVLNGMSDDIDITLAWQSPLPHDDLVSVQAAIAKRELDISNTTLQKELGYDPEEEAELTKAEDAQKIIAFSQGVGLPPAMPGVQPLPGQPPQTPTVQPGQASTLQGVK